MDTSGSSSLVSDVVAVTALSPTAAGEAPGPVGSPKLHRTPTSDVREHLAPGEFVVERVLSYKSHKGVRYAKVKWLGFKETTWEPAEQIFYCATVETPREAESLVGMRKKKGNIEYKVHWKGESPKNDTWMRKHKLARPDLVVQFEESLASVKQTKVAKPKRPRMAKRGSNTAQQPASTVPESAADGAVLLREVEKLEQTLPAEPIAPEKPIEKPTDVLIPSNEDPVVELLEVKQETRPTLLQQKNGNDSPVVAVEQWSVSEITDFLTVKGFPDAAVKLRDKEMDGKSFLECLDPVMLRKMDIPIGQGLKIIKLFRDLRSAGSCSGIVRIVL